MALWSKSSGVGALLLVERVKESMKGGRFEVVGGSWVELDGNVPSVEYRDWETALLEHQ